MRDASAIPAEARLLRQITSGRSARPQTACLPLPGPGRVGAWLAGLVAAARRQGAASVRVRWWPHGGGATFGGQSRIGLTAADARRCITEIRDAAGLPPDLAHAVGSFGCRGRLLLAEVHPCHDGVRAHVRAHPGASAPSGPAVDGALLDACLEGWEAVIGPRLSPEEALAARLAIEGLPAEELPLRACDLALLALDARDAAAGPLLHALADGLGSATADEAAEVRAECLRYVRGAAMAPARGLQAALGAWLQQASGRPGDPPPTLGRGPD